VVARRKVRGTRKQLVAAGPGARPHWEPFDGTAAKGSRPHGPGPLVGGQTFTSHQKSPSASRGRTRHAHYPIRRVSAILAFSGAISRDICRGIGRRQVVQRRLCQSPLKLDHPGGGETAGEGPRLLGRPSAHCGRTRVAMMTYWRARAEGPATRPAHPPRASRATGAVGRSRGWPVARGAARGWPT